MKELKTGRGERSFSLARSVGGGTVPSVRAEYGDGGVHRRIANPIGSMRSSSHISMHNDKSISERNTRDREHVDVPPRRAGIPYAYGNRPCII